MSRMLNRGAADRCARRRLSLESLEERVALDGSGLLSICEPLEQPLPSPSPLALAQGPDTHTHPRPVAASPPLDDGPAAIGQEEAFLGDPGEIEAEAADAVFAASSRPSILDSNNNGRVELNELQRWLRWWRSERQAPAPEPEIREVADYGGPDDRHLNQINAPEAWEAGRTGEGVVVAVIDTGVDLDHDEFRGQLWSNPDEIAGNGRDDDGNGYVDDTHGWDFVHDDPRPNDGNGHGSHVAGLLAGARDGRGVTGAAYGAEIMVLQGLDADGSGNSRDLAQAIRYAVDEGADIVNLSLSGVRSSTVESAIAYAQQQDVLIVAAAGNQGDAAPSAPASLSRQFDNVLSVGAVDSNGSSADFSNGPGAAVHVVAPGVSLQSAVANGGYSRYSGTSMATPLVASVAALTLEAKPNLSAADLRQLIVDGASGASTNDGALLVDAAQTLRFAA